MNTKYIRKCPNCPKKIKYKNKNSLDSAIKNNSKCKKCVASLRRYNFKIGEQIKTFTILNNIPKIKKQKACMFVKCKCNKEYWIPITVLNIKDSYFCCNKCYYKSITGKPSIFGNKRRGWTGVGEISRSTITKIKHRAKRRNLEYNLEDEYLWELFLKQNRKCACTGIELVFGNGFNIMIKGRFPRPTTASLDRIDSNKGYTKGNVQWVHKDIQTMKWNYDEKYFIELCKNVVNHAEQYKNTDLG